MLNNVKSHHTVKSNSNRATSMNRIQSEDNYRNQKKNSFNVIGHATKLSNSATHNNIN